MLQDLSRKDKPREQVSLAVSDLKRDRSIVRNSPEILALAFPGRPEQQRAVYVPPPPAHSNQYNRSPQTLGSSDHDSDARRDSYYPRPDSRNSRSPSLYSSRPVLHSVSPQPPRSSKLPPPAVINGPRSSSISPKHSLKGSITQGTPVNHISNSPRYEGLFRQIPTHQPKDGGSITLGTPVQHDVKRSVKPDFDGRIPSDAFPRPGLPIMCDPAAVDQFYRRMSPNAQQAATTNPYYSSGMPTAVSNLSHTFTGARLPTATHTPRPSFTNESHLSARQISIDFNTSKQMQIRQGSISSEKDSRLSPHLAQNQSPISSQPEQHHPPHQPYSYAMNTSSASAAGLPLYLPTGNKDNSISCSSNAEKS